VLPPILVGWIPFSLKEAAGDGDSFDLRRLLPLPPEYTNVRNAGTELEWLEPAYVGEPLSVQVELKDIVARQGRAGLGIYITQEEQVFNAADRIVARRRSTVVLLPARRLAEEGAGASA
jgi:hypothetical protein